MKQLPLVTIDACPKCTAKEIEGSSVEIESGRAFQKCECTRCGFMWVDEYILVKQFDKGYSND